MTTRSCTTEVILASASPRRRRLLEEMLSWPIKVMPVSIEEHLLPKEAPTESAKWLALLKASAIAVRFPECLVIGADTLVVVDGTVLGKPYDRHEALQMLKKLNGKKHLVVTGVAICRGDEIASDVEVTEVEFRKTSEEALVRYAELGEGDDKAGAYAIQGKGALLVRSIKGCYYNVVGMPLYLLSVLLEQFDIPLTCQWRCEKDEVAL